MQRKKKSGKDCEPRLQEEPDIQATPTATPTSSEVYDDGTNTFFWQAHTVTALFIITVGLVYVTFFEQVTGDTGYNIRRGAIAVIVVFILIGVIHMPDGPFVRPHPVFWRFVLCMSILYVLILIFALFQTVDDTRQFLKLYDDGLGVPLPERTYAEDCRLYTPEHPNGSFFNFMDKMDVFVPSHLIGWWVKAVILRDVWITNILSVAFELMEYTLEPQLPNFGECWWDHWVLDFLLCNGLGIWLGLKTCQYLEMREYHWMGLYKINTLKGKLKRAVSQFTPYSWTPYRWGYLDSFGRYMAFCVLIIFATSMSGSVFFTFTLEHLVRMSLPKWTVQELNTFYLKAILWIPPNHILNFYRELLYAFSGTCACNEIYIYLSTRDKNARIGRFSWLLFASIMIEIMVEIKYSPEIFLIPLSPYAFYLWGLFTLVLIVWTFWHFTVPFRDMPVIGVYFRQLEDKVKSS